MILNHHPKWLTECHKNIIIQALKVCIKLEVIRLKAIVGLYHPCIMSDEEEAVLGMVLKRG